MNEQAYYAVKAAQIILPIWGRELARAYANAKGVHPSLYRLARQLEAHRLERLQYEQALHYLKQAG
jgi:hypothetical protein